MDSGSTAHDDSLTDSVLSLEELQAAHAGCLKTIEELRREAAESAAAAKLSQDELQYFVYAASHDLQQPLRAIGTHAQLLQREYPEDPRAKELIKVIVDGASQMNGLLRDLLTYSRVGNVSEKANLGLNACFQWALYNVSKLIKEKGAQVTADDLPEVSADEKQIVTVFEHLLTNALRYQGSEPPQIKVESETDSEFHTVSIHDNGVGIRPEYHEKVFEPFKRLHSKDIPGNGLGLAVCRKILRAHGGRIWVESDGEHGSTLRFALPV